MTQHAPPSSANEGSGNYYSGSANFAGIAGSLVIGLIVGFVLAWLYALADRYIPSAKMLLLFPPLLGGALAALLVEILKGMKVRNGRGALAVIAVVMLFTYYVSWAAWEYLVLSGVRTSPTFLQLALHPDAVMRTALRINEAGTWSLGKHSDPVNGLYLSLLWLAEAASIFFFALIVIGQSAYLGAPLVTQNAGQTPPKEQIPGTEQDRKMAHVVFALVNREGAQHLILAFEPKDEMAKGDIPAHAIVGKFRDTAREPDWKAFSRNTAFVEFFTRYMKGGLPIRPAILDAAKVGAGEYVYVIDRRTADPSGDVPFHDIIGWYESDAHGRPVPESFVYNADHKIGLEDGTLSSILSDSNVHAAVQTM